MVSWTGTLMASRRLRKALAAVALFVGTGPLFGIPPERRPIEAVDDIRERLLRSDSLSTPAPDRSLEGPFAQRPNWRNFWPNWPNWRDWRNWPNWRNW